MCLVLLPTSLAQHSHSYGIDAEIPELYSKFPIVRALLPGPALSQCNRSSCIGPCASGAPRHGDWVDYSFCQVHLALENSVEMPYKFRC